MRRRPRARWWEARRQTPWRGSEAGIYGGMDGYGDEGWMDRRGHLNGLKAGIQPLCPRSSKSAFTLRPACICCAGLRVAQMCCKACLCYAYRQMGWHRQSYWPDPAFAQHWRRGMEGVSDVGGQRGRGGGGDRLCLHLCQILTLSKSALQRQLKFA